MNPQLTDGTVYQSLSKNGLRLHEIEFNAIILEIKKGIIEARHFLNAEANTEPDISFLTETGIIGFNPKTNSINIRLDYLNRIKETGTGLEYKDQLICFVPDKFYMVFKYLDWLRLFGMENAIHYYQFHNNPTLKVKFPKSFPENFSPKTLLLSDLEIEARETVDRILADKNEPPVWKKLNAYFALNFPQHYNKPMAELINLPRSDLQISFEMENLHT